MNEFKQTVPCYHVANANEARAIQFPFGTTALLINDAEPYIYLKSTTAMGSSFRCFAITEVPEAQAMASEEDRRLDRLEALVAQLVNRERNTDEPTEQNAEDGRKSA